jgi:hypothetical protein
MIGAGCMAIIVNKEGRGLSGNCSPGTDLKRLGLN